MTFIQNVSISFQKEFFSLTISHRIHTDCESISIIYILFTQGFYISYFFSFFVVFFFLPYAKVYKRIFFYIFQSNHIKRMMNHEYFVILLNKSYSIFFPDTFHSNKCLVGSKLYNLILLLFKKKTAIYNVCIYITVLKFLFKHIKHGKPRISSVNLCTLCTQTQ